ncbi:MAG TPA: PEGA domain-containing protein [Terriglobia bacterium]|nr:PEGA domain-containing protein [Terriglobia bacterium]
MSELNNLIDQARTSLLCLDALLQKAKLLDRVESVSADANSDGIQRRFENLIKMVEMLPENLKLEERMMKKEEMEVLLRQMEGLWKKLEASLTKIGSAVETNLNSLNETIEQLNVKFAPEAASGGTRPSSTEVQEMIGKCRQLFEDHQFEACIRMVQEVLRGDPGNPEASCLLSEAQRRWEDQRLEEELAVHVDNLKKEAMENFEKERYEECVGMFRFLCEMDPQNRTLRDYLELSQQKAQELRDNKTQPKPPSTATPSKIEPSTIPARMELNPKPQAESEPSHTTTGISLSPRAEAGSGQPQIPAGLPFLRPVARGDQEGENESSVMEPSSDEPERSVATAAYLSPKNIKWVGVMVLSLAVIGGLVLGIRSRRPAPMPLTGSLSVQTVPPGARVSVNGEFKGISPLYLKALEFGNYEVRTEKDGYQLNSQTLQVNSQTPVQISVLLEPSNTPPPVEVNLEERAGNLFEQGKFLESNRDCDAILASEPQSGFALNLKEKIRRALLKQGNQYMQKSRWEDARAVLNNVLVVSPRDPEAMAALKTVKLKSKKGPTVTESKESLAQAKINELRDQLTAATNSGNYFPPKPGNVVDLVAQLNQLSPDDPVGKEKMDQIYRDLLSQMQKRLQARDFENAKAVARQLQPYFAERSEFKNLRETLKAEESKTTEAKTSSVQKAEAAMNAGHYVLPVSDNAVVYCNRVLSLEPLNSKALSMKRDSLNKASSQARDWVQQGKYEEARNTFVALLQLSQNDSSFPFSAKELKAEIDRLEFTTFPVLHDHTLGNCVGRLKMNGYVLMYIPNGDPKCAFTQKISDGIQVEPGDKLKVQLRSKTYRFEPSPPTSKDDSREKINTMHQKLKQLMAKGT